jgi:hypothetical protein
MARRPHRSAAYRRAKAELAAGVVVCWECKERRASVPDHFPPLRAHVHVEGSGCCRLLPHCLACSRAQGGRQAAAAGYETAEPATLLDPVGFPVEHPVWDVPWLQRLLAVPENASWPRLMTPPHPDAVGSLGDVFAEAASERMGQPLRWVAGARGDPAARGRRAGQVGVAGRAHLNGQAGREERLVARVVDVAADAGPAVRRRAADAAACEP